jgi:hypothetical protein
MNALNHVLVAEVTAETAAGRTCQSDKCWSIVGARQFGSLAFPEESSTFLFIFFLFSNIFLKRGLRATNDLPGRKQNHDALKLIQLISG